MDAPKHLHLGLMDYVAVRDVQQNWIERCRTDGSEIVISCEHPPTLTLGRRVLPPEELELRRTFSRHEVEILRVSRGGMATLHLPGQLVIYPVISLRKRRLGVKEFVAVGLTALARAAQGYDVLAAVDMGRPGVWTVDGARKLGSVGLEILHGISNHGFALNLSCNLELFRLFSPCGLSGEVVSSLCAEIPSNHFKYSASDVSEEVCRNLFSELSLNL